MCRDGQDKEIVQHCHQVEEPGRNGLMWVSATSHATIKIRQERLDGGSEGD